MLVTGLATEFTITVKAEFAGTILARATPKFTSSHAGEAFSTDEATYTGAVPVEGAAILFVTISLVIEAACPPAVACIGFAEGFV